MDIHTYTTIELGKHISQDLPESIVNANIEWLGTVYDRLNPGGVWGDQDTGEVYQKTHTGWIRLL